jgi:hypothetical protein
LHLLFYLDRHLPPDSHIYLSLLNSGAC